MKRMYPHHIFVFLSAPIIEDGAGSLVAALRAAHFETLCQQYGLNSGGIEEVLTHLEVVGNPASDERPFFLVKYGLKLHQTLVIERWDTAEQDGKALLEAFKARADEIATQKNLEETVRILSIALSQVQLQDMGRLLAYEVARWAGFHGKGIVRGLDGVWYSLNQHQAFMPITNS